MPIYDSGDNTIITSTSKTSKGSVKIGDGVTPILEINEATNAVKVNGVAIGAAVQNAYYGVDDAGTDSYTVDLTPAALAYTDGMMVTAKLITANTGAASLALNALAAKPIKKQNDQDLVTGDIEAGQIATFIYNLTDDVWEMQSQVALVGGNFSNPAGADLSMGGFKITNLATPTADGEAVSKFYIDTLPLNDFIANADVDLDSHKLINVLDPTSDQDAATKKYVDDEVSGAGGGGGIPFAVDDGTASAYHVSIGSISVYSDGLMVAFRATNNSNSPLPTFQVNALGAHPISWDAGNRDPIIAGSIKADDVLVVILDTILSKWHIVSKTSGPTDEMLRRAGAPPRSKSVGDPDIFDASTLRMSFAADTTLEGPSNVLDGQHFTLEVLNTDVADHTLTLAAAYELASGITISATIAGKYDILRGVVRSSASAKAKIYDYQKGFTP